MVEIELNEEVFKNALDKTRKAVSQEIKKFMKELQLDSRTSKKFIQAFNLFDQEIRDSNKLTDDKVLKYAHVYDKFFTGPEIQELLKFYETKAGQKVLKAVPS